MRLAIIAFVAAVVWLQWQASLPPLHGALLPALPALACAAWLPRWRRPAWLIVAAALGVAYAGWRAETRLAQWLPAGLETRPLEIEGLVAGLPQPSRYGPRFRFAVERAPAGVPPLLLLNDYARPAADWQPGQRWRLTVRLKRPHGSANPGGTDYEAWLLGESIGASGSVARPGRQLLRPFVATPATALHAARQALAGHIRAALGPRPYAEVIVALVVGEQSGIPPAQWTLFRNSGITHLVSISGLHVTLVAGLAGALAGWAWRRSARLALRLPARQAALLAGVAAALGYSLLAGFSVPTQRTFFMLAVAALALLGGRATAVSTIWLAALGITVALDPWAVLSAGFWLSYLTVGAMLWALAGRHGAAIGWRARLAQWGAVQWSATLGSLPLLAILFQQLPLSSPLANALAIPLVSAVVTPLALAGALEPSGLLLRLAHAVLAFTLRLIEPLARGELVWSQALPPAWALLPACAAVALLLLPRGVPGRLASCVLLLPLLLPVRPGRGQGEFEATLFDVGQGLAVLVRTARHDLLFDTGAEGGGGRVLPGGLRALGVRRLDLLVLSHDDRDHIGGAPAVLASVPVAALLGVAPPADPGAGVPATGAPAAGAPAAGLPPHPPPLPCRAGQRWRWDGVDFEILFPDAATDPQASDNARSCVLKISGPGGSLLLPADIGRAEEAGLPAAALRTDVLAMPHHGSAGSSSPEFVAAAAPRLAVATSGYRNAFRHPRAEVVARYEAAGATVWRSDRDGAVTVRFGRDGWRAERWRVRHPRYWSTLAEGEAGLAGGRFGEIGSGGHGERPAAPSMPAGAR
ncbi:DNA internalization-related competence protein ComEC/Rec2 [Chitinimonas koreensis]|uniref:DNA internalization-related competence protein ComEC/Rec2 n=1 Tax=Chitinimonas koreensis TaxID=356302 RepID=UPI00040B2671|nr:DNA internalization-related competence protein ComEC/Rec2 [Chitinimonas koreensis]QNM97864.1 DNA internalization-related competence protein ComEC/Rec2 [Chitinimonas koreensis]